MVKHTQTIPWQIANELFECLTILWGWCSNVSANIQHQRPNEKRGEILLTGLLQNTRNYSEWSLLCLHY